MAHSSYSLKKLRSSSDSSSPKMATAQSRNSNRLQDAVYREIFLLESRRPGAEMGLALALLRAMVASEQFTNREEIRDWLAAICPYCLKMIESALNEYSA